MKPDPIIEIHDSIREINRILLLMSNSDNSIELADAIEIAQNVVNDFQAIIIHDIQIAREPNV